MPKISKDIYIRFNEISRQSAEKTIQAVRALGGNPITLSSDDPNAFRNLNLNGSSVIHFVSPHTFDSDSELKIYNQLSLDHELTFIPIPSGEILSDTDYLKFNVPLRVPLEQINDRGITLNSIAKKAVHPKIYKNEGNPVFISYARQSLDFADRLKIYLEGEQFEVWMDKSRITVGQEWKREIDNALEDSLAVVVVMCSNSATSLYVTYEWSYSLGLNTPIYPIRLINDDGVDYHPKLLDIHYADWTNRLDNESTVWDDLVIFLDDLV